MWPDMRRGRRGFDGHDSVLAGQRAAPKIHPLATVYSAVIAFLVYWALAKAESQSKAVLPSENDSVLSATGRVS
jgi:hypothetical protein